MNEIRSVVLISHNISFPILKTSFANANSAIYPKPLKFWLWRYIAIGITFNTFVLLTLKYEKTTKAKI